MFLIGVYLCPEEDQSILVEVLAIIMFSPFLAGIGEPFTVHATAS